MRAVYKHFTPARLNWLNAQKFIRIFTEKSTARSGLESKSAACGKRNRAGPAGQNSCAKRWSVTCYKAGQSEQCDFPHTTALANLNRAWNSCAKPKLWHVFIRI